MLTPTNLKITVASHVLGMHANPGIDEGGGGGGYTVHTYLGGLGACCRDFCATRELLVQSKALMQG